MMLGYTKRHCRTFAVIAALIGGYDTAVCQTRQKAETGNVRSALAPSPQAVAAEMWRKLLTTCPGSSSTDAFFTRPDNGDLFEFRGAYMKLVPMELTEADRLNGIQFRGFAVLRTSAYRLLVDQGHWSEWSSGEAVVTIGPGTPWELDGTDWSSVVVRIERRNNQWSF